MSTTTRMLGRGGKMYSFWAMNSFRMSAWTVPESFSGELPHGPDLAAVHRPVDAPRVGELARVAEVARVVKAHEVFGTVQRLDGPAGDGRVDARGPGLDEGGRLLDRLLGHQPPTPAFPSSPLGERVG